MLMDAVLGRFIAHSPMAVAVRGAFEYALAPTPLDDLFVRTVGHRDDRELLFSTCVDLMATVVCRVKPSIHAACQADDHLPVNVTAVYARLARVPATAGRDLVRHTANRLGPVIRAMGEGWLLNSSHYYYIRYIIGINRMYTIYFRTDNLYYVTIFAPPFSTISSPHTYFQRYKTSMTTQTTKAPTIHCGLIGFGMIFEETYRHLFDRYCQIPLHSPATGPVGVRLHAVATRTGNRSGRYLADNSGPSQQFDNFFGPDAISQLLASDVNTVCVATPDDRHFAAAREALAARKHVLIEKPSVLSLAELDELNRLAVANGVLAKVVYHKLADPDHKKLRTLYQDAVLQHVNNGYCSLLEPKSISGGQFAEWITGRNPATYVAVHYLKLIDFTFGPNWVLDRVSATGQRGIVGAADGTTWDSVQLQVVYRHPDEREAAFDIHTSWVTPDNFPGYVEQEVQFRFDNAVWCAHQRKRGVELTVENRTPGELKNTPNYHYNGTFLEPWGERSQRGYGIEVIERFFQEVAFVEFGGPDAERDHRLARMRALTYNDIAADRNCVAVVQSLEAILTRAAAGAPGCVVKVNGPTGGLVLYEPGNATPRILYEERV